MRLSRANSSSTSLDWGLLMLLNRGFSVRTVKKCFRLSLQTGGRHVPVQDSYFRQRCFASRGLFGFQKEFFVIPFSVWACFRVFSWIRAESWLLSGFLKRANRVLIKCAVR